MEMQIVRAYALARAHSHAWANDLWSVATEEGAWPTSWEEVDRALAIARPEHRGPAGLGRPTLSPAGWVGHLTGTRRLAWEIEPDGRARLAVCRPMPGPDLCCEDRRWGRCACGFVALYATVECDGRVTVEEFGPAFERHWAVLWRALLAIAPKETVQTASPIFDHLASR